jgi:fructose-bisphosphate aldolase class I
MRAWGGRAENVRAAQDAFYRRARMNSLARHGKWNEAQEKAA